MKIAIIATVLLIVGGAALLLSFRSAAPKGAADLAKGFFHELSVEGIDGGTIAMKDFKGKYVLCVNVASKCGYTPQYKDLQQLYETHRDKLVIIGFPCNQFMGQEPGSNEDIAAFCERNYGVTFPLSTKIDVKGRDQHPVYQWLCHQPLNGETEHEVKWNFHKFLVSPEGQLIGSFGSRTKPMDAEITTLIRG